MREQPTKKYMSVSEYRKDRESRPSAKVTPRTNKNTATTGNTTPEQAQQLLFGVARDGSVSIPSPSTSTHTKVTIALCDAVKDMSRYNYQDAYEKIQWCICELSKPR